MASQLRKVTGNRRLAADPRSALQAKIANLPQMLQQRQNRQTIKRDTAFQNKQIALQKAGAKQRKREQESAMGLEASKLGLTLGSSGMGQATLGEMFTGGQKAIRGATNKVGLTSDADPKVAPKTGGAWDVSPGSAISGGLTGYGIGKMIGGKNKAKKSLYGGGAGALMGMMSAPTGGGLGGLIGGGLGGALGGYFS